MATTMTARVYTVQPGSVVRIGAFGEASNAAGVRIPDAVASELSKRSDLRIERDESPAPKKDPAPVAAKAAKSGDKE